MTRRVRWLFRRLGQQVRGFISQNSIDPLPIRKGFQGYNLSKLRYDATAGLNVALLAFPQGMAYAVIADLPIQYGIVSGAVAAIIAPLFAGSRHTILGPTNATAFMLFSSFAAFSAKDQIFYLPMLVFMVGILLVIGALFRVAELIQYVSRSVVVGYITGAAVLIIANQLRHIMGVELPALDSTGPKTFFTILQGTIAEAGHTQWQTLALGAATFIFWFFFSRKFKKLPVFAITLLVISGAYFLLQKFAGWQVSTFESFTISDLAPNLPEISSRGFFSDISRLTGLAFSIAFLASLENSVMSKTLASRAGDRPDVNQDMLSVGIANLASAFTGGMPASGSLTRSSLNYESGSKTVFSNLFSGIIILIGILAVGTLTQYIPTCALSVLVIIVGLSLLNKHAIRIVTQTTGSDAVVFLATLLSGLYISLDSAIYFGVGISILLFLKKVAKPELKEYSFNKKGDLLESENSNRNLPEVSIVHVEGELFFGAADLFQEQMRRIYEDPKLKIVILKMRNAYNMDASSVMALEELVRHMNKLGRYLILSEVKKDLLNILIKSGVAQYIEDRNIFNYDTSNPTLSTARALKRAKEHLGEVEPNVSIYAESKKK